MKEKNDFMWGKGKVLKNGTLGKIVAIPAESDADGQVGEKRAINDENVDFEIDEFKGKIAEKLSKELHKDEY
ncbi:MAG: hypothetical protein JW705_02570 [Methanosarcinaceae archaeon]|nr:hypothetical protein [Methanosarcinaceae archaeon]